MKIDEIFNESIKVTKSNSPKTIRQLLTENPDRLVQRIRKKLNKTFIKVSPHKFYKVVTEYPFNNQENLISEGDGVTLYINGDFTRVFGIIINNDFYIHRKSKDIDQKVKN